MVSRFNQVASEHMLRTKSTGTRMDNKPFRSSLRTEGVVSWQMVPWLPIIPSLT